MNNEIQNRLLRSLFATLVPLVRILLRYGITYRQFADVSKRVFLREAFSETDEKSRRTNSSRVAVRTGISRKEVRRLRDEMLGESVQERQSNVDHSGPPARVLHSWHVDARYLTDAGTPRELMFEHGDPSFASLVRAVAGDVPPGAVRAELRRAGAIEEAQDGSIRATKRYYVPGNVDEKAITVISGMLFPLAAGLDHNSNPKRTSDGFIQRFAFSERLETSQVPAFRLWSRREATRFIESVDDWLAANESPPPALPSKDEHGRRVISGVGVFYYEGPVAEDVIRD